MVAGTTERCAPKHERPVFRLSREVASARRIGPRLSRFLAVSARFPSDRRHLLGRRSCRSRACARIALLAAAWHRGDAQERAV